MVDTLIHTTLQFQNTSNGGGEAPDSPFDMRLAEENKCVWNHSKRCPLPKGNGKH